MSKNPETYIQDRVKKKLKEKGYFVIRLDPVNGAGLPDLLAIKDGKAHFYEIKTPKGKLSKLQQLVHKLLEEQGAKITVARSLDDVI